MPAPSHLLSVVGAGRARNGNLCATCLTYDAYMGGQMPLCTTKKEEQEGARATAVQDEEDARATAVQGDEDDPCCEAASEEHSMATLLPMLQWRVLPAALFRCSVHRVRESSLGSSAPSQASTEEDQPLLLEKMESAGAGEQARKKIPLLLRPFRALFRAFTRCFKP
jgi:hypothetical protein